MKTNIKHILISFAVIIVLVTACTTAKVTPATSAAPAVTNYIVSPKLTTALDTVGSINAVTAPVNPYSPIIDIGLGGIAAIAAWVAKRKNDAAAQQALLLKTVIQGVENANLPAVKTAIQTQAVAIGVEGSLGNTVSKVNSGIL